MPESSGSSNIKVVVRVRPANEKEVTGPYNDVIEILDDQVLIFDPKKQNDSFYFKGKKEEKRNLLYKANKDCRFIFDKVFNHHSTNEEVFENTTRGLLEGLLNGYNCSVFAYGATGAGKTHTMLGNQSESGVMVLTIMDLFRRIEEIKDEKSCEVAVSYLEIYNENIVDLLKPSGPLTIREDNNKNVIVTGLSIHKPQNSEELLSKLEFGNKNRSQHPTDANLESSRSHAVCIVYVKQKDRTAKLTASVKVAKLCLVDLAGSERATMISSNKIARIREGANINKSLLALGSCINALADTKKKFIPYRNSKLTHLLKDAIGGNCRTVMIATVSPSSLSFEDTYNTLKYAERAKHISIDLKTNVRNIDVHFSKYPQIVAELHQEIVKLKEKLHEAELKTPAVPKPPPFGTPKKEEISRLNELLQRVFAERKVVQKDRLELEFTEREIEARIHYRQLDKDRLSLIAVDNLKFDREIELATEVKDATKFNQSAVKADCTIQFLEGKKQRINEKKQMIIDRLQENKECQLRIESEAKLINSDGQIPEELTDKKKMHQLELELLESRLLVKFLKSSFKAELKKGDKTERLLRKCLKTMRHNYLLLKAYDLTTSDINEDFESLVRQVEGTKEVIWADQHIPKDDETTYHDFVASLCEIPLTCEVKLTPAALRTPYRTRISSTPSSCFIKNCKRRLSHEVSMETTGKNFFDKTRSTPLKPDEKLKPSFMLPLEIDEMGSILDLATPLKNLSSTFSLDSPINADSRVAEKVSKNELSSNHLSLLELPSPTMVPIDVPTILSSSSHLNNELGKTRNSTPLLVDRNATFCKMPCELNLNETFTAEDKTVSSENSCKENQIFSNRTFLNIKPKTQKAIALKENTESNIPDCSQTATSTKVHFDLPKKKSCLTNVSDKKGIARKIYGNQAKPSNIVAKKFSGLRRTKSVSELSTPKREQIASCINELNLMPQRKVTTVKKSFQGPVTPARVKVDFAMETNYTSKPSTSGVQKTGFKASKLGNPQWRR